VTPNENIENCCFPHRDWPSEDRFAKEGRITHSHAIEECSLLSMGKLGPVGLKSTGDIRTNKVHRPGKGCVTKEGRAPTFRLLKVAVLKELPSKDMLFWNTVCEREFISI
jgi:hypothetical protein